jgi:hypothetical protein
MINYENLKLTNLPFDAAFQEKMGCFLKKGWYIFKPPIRIAQNKIKS